LLGKGSYGCCGDSLLATLRQGMRVGHRSDEGCGDRYGRDESRDRNLLVGDGTAPLRAIGAGTRRR